MCKGIETNIASYFKIAVSEVINNTVHKHPQSILPFPEPKTNALWIANETNKDIKSIKDQLSR